MSFEIIVGIPLLIEATILCIQNILEVPSRIQEFSNGIHTY